MFQYNKQVPQLDQFTDGRQTLMCQLSQGVAEHQLSPQAVPTFAGQPEPGMVRTPFFNSST